MSMSCHDASGDDTLNADAKVSSGIKRIVLVGNPNCGKSTLFNLITGMSVHVGNWPGVTVDVKMAQWKVNGEIWEVVDLPGSYSLLGKNADEQVTSSFLLSQEYDVILNVVDSTSLERSLMLTLELLDLQKLTGPILLSYLPTSAYVVPENPMPQNPALDFLPCFYNNNV